MNRRMILDDIFSGLMILSGLLSFAVCGRDMARVIIAFNAGEYKAMIPDLIWAIVLFILGFRNFKISWHYINARLKL